MDFVLIFFGIIFMIAGVLGSFLPILPGPPLSWIGLLLLHLTKIVPANTTFLVVTLVVAILVLVLDYVIPAVGTKRFGGSKIGMIGTTLGLLVAIIFPVFGVFGIVIWPFIGALIGELINKSTGQNAMKAAFGSFIGFLASTFLKFIVAVIYFGFFIKSLITYGPNLF
ncbi:DUF456 domain-containing protein [Paucihalobacter ruber]|uniref:DUF456 domain-containing protein n=1 Tax=Paucihalobacter ruber TaxID=2567861 RepID=A0A506PE64_9FLAO|nr:DUF456 domain-containing protein [Paucihalobacter ruber]TPV31798.1 DUF456 domain-containing protein [Paucihalobacter ruber]